MLKKETLILLRMPFSIFLLPVFLFAWSQLPTAKGEDIVAVFVLLHILVYPAANGYASGLEKKSTPTPRQLWWVVNGMDLLAILISFSISSLFAAQISGLILASRIYSNPVTRLNRFPVLNFFWMSFFYGFVVYWAVQTALGGTGSGYASFTEQLWAKWMVTALVGSMFLFTQLYQNELNKRDGIQTLSSLLGYQGSFALYALLFALADYSAWRHFQEYEAIRFFLVFQFFLFPLLLYGSYWFIQVKKNTLAADFDHATRMRLLTCLCLNLCFLSFLISGWLAT
ncbi:MAG: UbiA prenyltransferase family protein [Bacteroidia bacterium]